MKPLQFPATLSKMIDDAQISQRELARRCGFGSSLLTNLLDGQRCTPEVLSRIVTELGSALGNGAPRYFLLCAHLHDEVVRAGLNPAHVVIRHVEGVVLGELDLSVETNAHLGLIAKEAEKNADVAGMLEDWAHLIMRHEAELADAKAQVVPFVAAEDKPAAKKSLPPGAAQQPTA